MSDVDRPAPRRPPRGGGDGREGWEPGPPLDEAPAAAGPAVTDRDEWLHPEAVHDEVLLEVDEPAGPAGGPPPGAGPLSPPAATGLVLRVSLAVTPAGRHVHLTATVGGARARHDAEELGPPPTNWDRMRLGGVEWRMVEPLRRWDLSVEDLDAGLRAYLTFTGSEPPRRVLEGYEQRGAVSGQVQLADRRATVTAAPARRTHLWR